MTASFEDNNRAYLSAAVEWLRLRLMEIASVHAAAAAQPFSSALAPTGPSAPADEGAWHWWPTRRRHDVAATSSQPLPARRQPGPGEKQAAPPLGDAHAAAARMRAAEAAVPQPALPVLAQVLGLSGFERNVLLLCAAMELDPGLSALCARAAGSDARPWPTFALALEAFEDPRWDALSPERPLRRWRLVEISQSGMQPLVSAPLRIDERVGAYVGGLNYLDERLAALLQPMDEMHGAADETRRPSQGASIDEAVAAAKDASAAGGRIAIQLVGADATSRRAIAHAAAAQLERRVLLLAADSVPSAGEVENFIRLWEREAQLLPLALVIELPDEDLSAEATSETTTPRTRLLRVAARVPGLVLVSTLDPAVEALPGSTVVEVQRLSPEEQASCWRAALGDEHAATADELAAQFSLDAVSIQMLARRALAADEDATTLRDRLWRACVRHSRPALEGLAQRIEPRQGWSALKLPAREAATLARIRDHMRHRATVHGRFGFRAHLSRGLGTAALFCGESGTGKTLAAEVLAGDLGLALYRIDLAGLMNKYIGVTEKHIRQVFDAGDGAVLFFDECEGLFAQRNEVKDSNDRYANLQVDYLLQRMESYSGLAILATNLRSVIDPAFLRRLRFVVNFPFPGPVERAAIWRNAFPAATPLDPLDYAQLAKLPLTGGSIQNIAIDAAFRAAAQGVAVSMAIIAEAAEDELRKIERPPSLSQFRWARGQKEQAQKEHAS
jgi:hypothetical protein